MERLGMGSFGIVHLVQRRAGNALFELKKIDFSQPNMQEAMKGLDIMTKLPPHRNFVRLYEHWDSTDKKDMWLFVEYYSQGTLSRFLIGSAAVSAAALLDLRSQLLHALLLFEQHHIVHNNIKPKNIFMMWEWAQTCNPIQMKPMES